VDQGDKLLVLEAMKTQQPVTAQFAGKVSSLPVVKGQQVNEGQLLVKVEPVA
jgi:biotin carboxyl carrier protein